MGHLLPNTEPEPGQSRQVGGAQGQVPAALLQDVRVQLLKSVFTGTNSYGSLTKRNRKKTECFTKLP